VTYKKSDALREVAKMVPLSQLLIETDAPFLAPQSHRGKPNEPAFLPETAHCIAKAKGIPLEEVARATAHNATRLLQM
jgi:TatD DNase family protein